MKDQLLLLEDLQRHDAKLQEMEVQLREIPERLKGMKNDLARVEEMLEGERRKLAETEAYKGDQDRSLANEEAASQKAKQKLQAVKNTKEYMATQRELEATRKMATDREEEVIKLMAAIEDFRKRITAHEEDVQTLRDTVAKEEADAQAIQGRLESEMQSARSVRDELAKKVRPDVMRKYASIRMKRGLAVVAVKNGTCLGCHMNIPPQLFNQLQRAQSIETCPICNRIIYWDKIMEPVIDERKEREEAAESTAAPEGVAPDADHPQST